jgi:3-methyl-2-oxobutanoate hydroxymethyltransferase
MLPVEAIEMRVNHLAAMKRSGQKIVALTAYDYPMARLVDQAGVDLILVGDSLANVVLGHSTTLPVTMDQMVHHAAAVRRGVTRALTVADMPFLSWQTGWEDAVRNAGRFLSEAGMAAVKLEGGGPAIEAARRLVATGIPVIGHLGYTPQSVHRFGSEVVQGKTGPGAEAIFEDARALEAAGVSAIVLECVTPDLARSITARIAVPTIGIGSGRDCDGQILVLHDALGLTPHPPRFAKAYLNLSQLISAAVEDYANEVRDGAFPAVRASDALKCV